MGNNLKKPFNKRAFVSISMFSSGMILPFSGIMNHRLQLETLSSQRHFWMAVHNMSATLFCIFAVWHVFYNWKALMNHIRQLKGISISKEAIYAMLLVFVVVGFYSSHAFHVH